MAYGLEKVTSPEAPIYQQLTNYYDFCDHVIRMSKATMCAKTGAINYFVKFSGISRLEDISNQMVYDWISYMESRGNTGRSINNRLQQLKVMLRWERDDNISMPNLKIARIAMQKEVPPRKTYFSRSQINKALSFADRREWLMIKLCFDCGLRLGELTNLRISDIKDRKIRVVGKGNRLRYVKMSKEVRVRLSDWIQRENISDYLWTRPRSGKPLSKTEVARAMAKPFVAAGFNNFHPHALRHSYATELKNLNIPTRQIQLCLGHSSEAITERYLHDLDGFDIEEVYDVKYSIIDPDLR